MLLLHGGPYWGPIRIQFDNTDVFALLGHYSSALPYYMKLSLQKIKLHLIKVHLIKLFLFHKLLIKCFFNFLFLIFFAL